MSRYGVGRYAAAAAVVAWASVALGGEPTSSPAPTAAAGEGAAPEPDEAAPAEADDPGLAQARDAFRLGSALAKQGQWTEALAAFERSQSLRAHPVTGFNIGYVERALGHLTRARKEFLVALAGSRGAKLPPNLEQEARSYLKEIDRKVARAVVTLQPQTAVAIDGRPLEPDAGAAERPVLVAGTAAPGAGTEHALTSFDLIIDPGDHVIVLSREGVADTVLNERFETGASRQLPLAMQAPAEASSPTPARPAADPEADVAVSSADATNETLMWVSYGVGAAGIAAGSVFGVLALGKKGELDDGPCNGVPKDQCQPGAGFDSLESDMNTFALASTIGFIVGGVGAAAGTYFLIAGSDGEEPAASRSSVTARAYIGPGSVKVSGTF